MSLCQLLELYNHTIIVKYLTSVTFWTKVKSYINIRLTMPVNCDHVITQCQQISLTFKVHLSSQNPKLSPAMAAIICNYLSIIKSI